MPFVATGAFTGVSAIDVMSSTPSLSTLDAFDTVLAFTDFFPANPAALGNVLADYVDQGHRIDLATYGFSTPWSVTGRITTTGYSPLTNLGVNGNVSGSLSAVVPSDSVFTGVDPSTFHYRYDSSYAHPGLDAGATLLATDGNGINMIARSGNGLVTDFNIFPATYYFQPQALYEMMANALTQPLGSPAISTPEPGSMALLGLASLGMAGYGWRRRRQTPTTAA